MRKPNPRRIIVEAARWVAPLQESFAFDPDLCSPPLHDLGALGVLAVRFLIHPSVSSVPLWWNFFFPPILWRKSRQNVTLNRPFCAIVELRSLTPLHAKRGGDNVPFQMRNVRKSGDSHSYHSYHFASGITFEGRIHAAVARITGLQLQHFQLFQHFALPQLQKLSQQSSGMDGISDNSPSCRSASPALTTSATNNMYICI
jgi:hypothetical protein